MVLYQQISLVLNLEQEMHGAEPADKLYSEPGAGEEQSEN